MERTNANTIAEYIEASPEEHRETLQMLYDTVREAAPKATESIAYGMPAFKQGKPVFYFAIFPHHIGLYPTPEVVEAFKDRLLGYKTSKGAIQIPIGTALPLPLIKEMIAYRLESIGARK